MNEDKSNSLKQMSKKMKQMFNNEVNKRSQEAKTQEQAWLFCVLAISLAIIFHSEFLH